MKALTFRGLRNIVYEDVPDPVIIDQGDAIVKVEYSAICGSDGFALLALIFMEVVLFGVIFIVAVAL